VNRSLGGSPACAPDVSALADVPSVPLRSSSWNEDIGAVVEAVERYRRK